MIWNGGSGCREALGVQAGGVRLAEGLYAAWHRQPGLPLVAGAQVPPDRDAEKAAGRTGQGWSAGRWLEEVWPQILRLAWKERFLVEGHETTGHNNQHLPKL